MLIDGNKMSVLIDTFGTHFQFPLTYYQPSIQSLIIEALVFHEIVTATWVSLGLRCTWVYIWDSWPFDYGAHFSDIYEHWLVCKQ